MEEKITYKETQPHLPDLLFFPADWDYREYYGIWDAGIAPSVQIGCIGTLIFLFF